MPQPTTVPSARRATPKLFPDATATQFDSAGIWMFQPTTRPSARSTALAPVPLVAMATTFVAAAGMFVTFGCDEIPPHGITLPSARTAKPAP